MTYRGHSKSDALIDSPTQLTQQIRFALDSLSESNGHHEFEKICFAFGRRRISLNLIPATGPVSSGGDQGRDSESFWSNLPNELPDTSVHLARVAKSNVAVACTIQKSKIASKVRSDLVSITTQGTKIDRVLFFTVAPVPVSTRHDLIKEAQERYGVALEIFDGPALADHLSDPDLYWIAADFLRLPLSLAPERPSGEGQLPAWYVRDRDMWRKRKEAGRTLGDFVSLKDILRHATYHDDARMDVGDWIARMREFLFEENTLEIRMRAAYEVSVATLRGTGSLEPADHLFREVFRHIGDETINDLSFLEDAVVLLAYGYGARLRGHTNISMDELDQWYSHIRSLVASALSAGPQPGAKAALLAIDVRLALFPAYPRNLPSRIEGLPTPQDTLQRVLTAQSEDRIIDALAPAIPVRDIDGGMSSLSALLNHLPNAPTFPVEHTADLFTFCTLSLAEHPHYDRLRDGLDDAVARVEGDSSRASRASARAHAFLEAGQVLRALAEVHEAKVMWWHGETLHESIPMMLLAASIYEDMGLFFAAKLHASAAAIASMQAADASMRAHVPEAIMAAASCDSKAGNWCSSSRLVRVGMMSHLEYAENAGAIDQYPYVQVALARESLALQVARDFAPDYEELVRSTARELGVETILDQLVPAPGADPEWTLDALLASLDSRGFGRPFGDAGLRREHRWSAFGITWSVRSRSSRSAALAAERLMAAMQIVQAELANSDAEWIPGHVDIEVRLDGSPSHQRCERLPSNTTSKWVAHLVSGRSISDETYVSDLVVIVAELLKEHTLLPDDEFSNHIRDAIERGLSHKISGGRPYDEAAGILSDDDYAIISRLPDGPVGRAAAVAQPVAHPSLKPPTGTSDRHDQRESLERIQRRYDAHLPIARLTIARLATEPAVRQDLLTLRERGWLDWQLLMAISTIVGNARVEWEGIELRFDSPPADKRRANQLMRRAELPSDPELAPDRFSIEELEPMLEFVALLTLPSYGLKSHALTPNAEKIIDVLKDRYQFAVDDVPHEDFLGLNSPSGLETASPTLPRTDPSA